MSHFLLHLIQYHIWYLLTFDFGLYTWFRWARGWPPPDSIGFRWDSPGSSDDLNSWTRHHASPHNAACVVSGKAARPIRATGSWKLPVVWQRSEYLNARWMEKSTWISMWHRMDQVAWSLDRFQKTPLGGRSNTKLGDHGTPKAHNRHLFLQLIQYHIW